jgi:hypothetical protein
VLNVAYKSKLKLILMLLATEMLEVESYHLVSFIWVAHWPVCDSMMCLMMLAATRDTFGICRCKIETRTEIIAG